MEMMEPAPTVFLSGSEFAGLPEKGRVTFEFVRRRVTASKDIEGETDASVVLALTCLCEVEESKMSPKKEPKTEDVLDELLEEVQEESKEESKEESEEESKETESEYEEGEED